MSGHTPGGGYKPLNAQQMRAEIARLRQINAKLLAALVEAEVILREQRVGDRGREARAAVARAKGEA